MGIIKKFRIKSFKKNKALVSLDKISLSFGKRRILEDVSFNINEGEILTTINVPGLPPGATCGFSEIARRHGDFALAMCVAVLSRINGGYARLVINGMGNGPQRIENAEKVLLDGKFSETSIKAASKIVIEELDPLNDIHAPGWYRKKMARVMMIRACNMAVALMEQK